MLFCNNIKNIFYNFSPLKQDKMEGFIPYLLNALHIFTSLDTHVQQSINAKPSIRMGKEDDFELGIVIGARRPGLSIFEYYWDFYTQPLGFRENVLKERKSPVSRI